MEEKGVGWNVETLYVHFGIATTIYWLFCQIVLFKLMDCVLGSLAVTKQLQSEQKHEPLLQVTVETLANEAKTKVSFRVSLGTDHWSLRMGVGRFRKRISCNPMRKKKNPTVYSWQRKNPSKRALKENISKIRKKRILHSYGETILGLFTSVKKNSSIDGIFLPQWIRWSAH